MKNLHLLTALAVLLLFYCSCKEEPVVLDEPNPTVEPTSPDLSDCPFSDFNYQGQKGCDGKTYPDPATTPYGLPFPPETVFKTGLTNCSSSFHGSDQPDRYATDFDLPEGTIFTAARAGRVIKIVEDQPSNGGGSGAGNYLVIDHQDNTYGLYYHSPKDGIYVEVGNNVAAGQALGEVGKSGLAGYPHLHFTVALGGFAYPYNGIPVSFRDVRPADVILNSYQEYQVCAR